MYATKFAISPTITAIKLKNSIKKKGKKMKKKKKKKKVVRLGTN